MWELCAIFFGGIHIYQHREMHNWISLVYEKKIKHIEIQSADIWFFDTKYAAQNRYK